MTKVLHIGLNKCASSFLQKKIFNLIAKEKKIDFLDLHFNDYFKVKKNKESFHILDGYKNIEKNLPDKFIISNEGLFSRGGEFSRIYKSFEIMKSNFSDNTIILMIIRNPYEILNSIYNQSIKEMRIIEPKDFFYVKDTLLKRDRDKFNLYNFNYSELILLYKSYFKKVVVVKHEEISSLNFLNEIFDLEEETYNKIKYINNNFNLNESVSTYAVKFTLFVNKFINLNNFKNNKLIYFLFKFFIKVIINNLFPKKKYSINKKYIPININTEIAKYNKIKL